MNSWHAVSPRGQQLGPISREQVIQMIRGGGLRADSLVWTESFGENWQPIAQTEFAYLLKAQASAPPPPNPPIPPQSYASWQQDSTQQQGADQTQFSPASTYVQNQSFTEKSIVIIVYILYILSLLSFYLPTIIAVIIAYVKRDSSSSVAQTHFTFQIYTFWLSFLLLPSIIFGALLSSALLNAPAIILLPIFLLIFFFWYIIRIVKGIIYANDNRGISQPRSWWFG